MCSIENCNLENFEDKDKCILHCEKDDWYKVQENGYKSWYGSEKKLKLFGERLEKNFLVFGIIKKMDILIMSI
ncbi:hypothetical protein CRV02_12570 [Arcobacter sp. CECT 8989]|uniref:hypothetical protein n=1 Tax=Arcobacter sp. CECT 8989 TaxID=2044509 RepID=UPI00100B5091|nr:hypothetical protein [Arcobacter sp. CECT 8989]RXJ99022.1 hypothetical protein CRV02_12570 [Arcobacter sp. CECT 8989]